jgi:hypothetical protein
MTKTTFTPEQAAKIFGVSIERIKKQYLANAQVFGKKHKRAVLTGKKVNGYTAEQLEKLTSEYYQKAI